MTAAVKGQIMPRGPTRVVGLGIRTEGMKIGKVVMLVLGN